MDDIETASLRKSPLIVVGSASLSVSGLITAAVGLQLLLASYTVFALLLGAFVLILGLATCVIGGLIYKPRLWAIGVGIGVSCFSCVFLALLNAYLLLTMVVTPLAMFAGAASLLSVVLVGISTPAHIRLSKARSQLYS